MVEAKNRCPRRWFVFRRTKRLQSPGHPIDIVGCTGCLLAVSAGALREALEAKLAPNSAGSGAGSDPGGVGPRRTRRHCATFRGCEPESDELDAREHPEATRCRGQRIPQPNG